MPHATQMSAADTGLLVIDVQEKLVPMILDAPRLLNLPIQCTEQYSRGLGATVPELADKLPWVRATGSIRKSPCAAWSERARFCPPVKCAFLSGSAAPAIRNSRPSAS